MTIAYITETAPDNKHAWSGTAHYVYTALTASGFKVRALGPAVPIFQRYVAGSLNKLSLLLFGKRIDYRHSTAYSKAFARIFHRKLAKIPHDLIVVCGGTEYGAFLRTDKPVFYVLDRTIAGALNYHTILKDLWKFSERQSVATDRKAMLGATTVFFSSAWAADHARKFYKLPDDRIRVLPFGANLDRVPSREEALKAKDLSHCRLLLVGTYWKNKGADIAVEALRILLNQHVNASLTVVGCTPPAGMQQERLRIIPFVDKNTEAGMKQMWDLFMSHHFFILPTRFDCTPIVFCEASAFGLPVLSADTGGVEGHITPGVNGFLMPYNDDGGAYAGKILELVNHPEAYAALCRSSREAYEQRLNWEVWAREFRNEVEQRSS